jgi:hypothetical protein
MWGRRRKRGTRLSRLLALGDLEDALAHAEQQQEGEPEPVPYPPASTPAPDIPAARPSLNTQDVPVDNSAGPEATENAAPQHHQGLPVQRSRDSTRHGSFG